MIEQAMRSALLLLAGMLLSAGALGQTVVLTQDNFGVVVASEFFGAADGREVLFNADSQPGISVDITAATGAANPQLDVGNEVRLTFTLLGATFAASVTSNSLAFYDNPAGNARGGGDDLLGTGLLKSVDSGGAVGDSSVTFLLEVQTAIDIDADTGAEYLWFEPPNLQVDPVPLNPADQNSALGAMVVVTSVPGQANSNPFPATVLGSGRAPAGCGAVSATCRAVVDSRLDGQIVQLQSALTPSLGTGSTANVSLANRKVIDDNSGVAVTMKNGDRVRGLRVGSLSVTLNSGSRILRSEADAVSGSTLNSALGGTADVTVQGPFQDGDMVLLGANQRADGAKVFDRGAAGTMTTSVALGAVSGTPVIYVPGGVDDLTPGIFQASLALDFNDPLSASGRVAGAAGASNGTLSYEGIETQAYAYGISRANDAEITSFLRTTCASVTPPATVCSVFINCAGEDGARYFGELTANAPLRNGATGVYTSGDIASALGGGWSAGGGRCDLLSNGDLEVQHMIRTSGNALHNNSIVIGRTQSDNVGILRSRGPHPVGSVTLSLGPAVTPGEVRLLSTGRIYGPIDFIRALAAQLRGSTGLQPGTRFYAPPGAMSGGRQPMDHEPGCAFLERDLTVTPVNCFHLDDANPDARLADSRVLMSGDILYPNRAVYRPSDSTLLQPAASATATVLSG